MLSLQMLRKRNSDLIECEWPAIGAVAVIYKDTCDNVGASVQTARSKTCSRPVVEAALNGAQTEFIDRGGGIHSTCGMELNRLRGACI